VTAEQLREQLASIGIHRDLRTIRRQLAMLCLYFGVECDASRPGGYWRPRAVEGLSLAALSEPESLLLMLAQKQLAAFLPPSVTKALDGFFEQARCNLDPFGDAVLAKQWLSKVRVIGESLKLLPPPIAPGVLETVSEALYANRWLRMRYKDAEGRVSRKRVMPLGLALQGPRLYLVCRYGNGDERSLALHRMGAVHAEANVFERPADFDFERFDDDGALAFGDGTRVQLSFSIQRKAGFHLTESKFSHDQTVRVDGDRLHFRATVADSMILHRWLYGFSQEMCDLRKDVVVEGKRGRRE
jgi:predicted DNA-binding transcriptional regulator YafY